MSRPTDAGFPRRVVLIAIFVVGAIVAVVVLYSLHVASTTEF